MASLGVQGLPIDGNPEPDTILMRGGSCIIGPLGQILAEQRFDEDAILTAEIDPGEITRASSTSMRSGITRGQTSTLK